MKKSNLTYAQQAKKIISKYKKRLGDDFERYDKMAVESMNKELAALMQQQEDTKAATAQNMYQEMPDQMAYGGQLPQLDGYGNSIIPNGVMWPAEQYYKDRKMKEYHWDDWFGKNSVDRAAVIARTRAGYVNNPIRLNRSTNKVAQAQPGIVNTRNSSVYDPYATQQQINQTPAVQQQPATQKVVTNPSTGKKSVVTVPVDNRMVNGPLGNYANFGPQTPGYADFEETPEVVAQPTVPANVTQLQESLQGINPETGQSYANDKKTWWSQIPNESKIGAAAQLAGVLGQGIIAATAGKPKPIYFNPIADIDPELVRNDEQIAQATRAYRGAQNNLRYLSPSQYMAAMSDMATREAATKAGIVEGTENTNVGIRNAAKAQNTAIRQANEQGRISAEQINEAARLGYVQNMGQTLANTLGVVAGFAKDEGARKMQNSMMQFMSQSNYGSVIGKNGYPISTNKVGDMEYWTDVDGPHYKVRGTEVSPKVFDKRWRELEEQRSKWESSNNKK